MDALTFSTETEKKNQIEDKDDQSVWKKNRRQQLEKLIKKTQY